MSTDRYENIPQPLRGLTQWVCWGGLPDKPKAPQDPKTLRMAKCNDPTTWGSFDQAARRVGAGAQGVGIEFAAGGGLVGVDFDHCLGPDGDLDPWVAGWVERLGSYTEISPSGSGLHVICRGTLPGAAVKRPLCEMYDRDRYFTVTGNQYGSYWQLRDAQTELEALYRELSAQRETTAPLSAPVDAPDKDLLAVGLQRDERLVALWNGARPNGNESSDDQALMNKLAYWCSCDPAAMQAAFLASPHFQGKDDSHKKKAARRADYLRRTIESAIRSCTRTAAQDDADYTARLAAQLPARPAGDVFGRSEYKTAPQPARLATISARQLQDKDLPPVRFVVEGLLPQGLALLVSPPKFGKSWFVLDLCLSVAAGISFLGRSTMPGGCLYLALEDSERRLQSRMNKLLDGARAPDRFDYATAAPALGQGLLEQLRLYLQEHPGCTLIVVDTLQKVRGATGGKESAYSADYREVGQLKTFADAHGICLLLVHHLRKMKDDDDPFNRISGTSGIFGAADTAMVMTRAKRTDENTTFSVTGRDVDSSDTVLRFDKRTCRWQCLGDADFLARERARLEYEQSPIVDTLRRLLKQGGGEWSGTMKDLMEAGRILAHTYLAESPEALTRRVRALEPMLFQQDSISHSVARNGSGGRKHTFHLLTGWKDAAADVQQTEMEVLQ